MAVIVRVLVTVGVNMTVVVRVLMTVGVNMAVVERVKVGMSLEDLVVLIVTVGVNMAVVVRVLVTVGVNMTVVVRVLMTVGVNMTVVVRVLMTVGVVRVLMTIGVIAVERRESHTITPVVVRVPDLMLHGGSVENVHDVREAVLVHFLGSGRTGMRERNVVTSEVITSVAGMPHVLGHSLGLLLVLRLVDFTKELMGHVERTELGPSDKHFRI